MSTVNITLPDGSVKSVAAGMPLDIAKESALVLPTPLVARLNGDLVDLTRPIEDSQLEILTSKIRLRSSCIATRPRTCLPQRAELYPETSSASVRPPSGFSTTSTRNPVHSRRSRKARGKDGRDQARNLP
jgi:hypothetical protein